MFVSKKYVIILISFLVFSLVVQAQKSIEIQLYKPSGIFKEYQKIDPEVDTLAFTVTDPTISVFLPEKQNRKKQAVLICPGGGYHTLLMSREGYRIAREFNKHGIVAIVLKYRLPVVIDSIQNKPLAPIQDVQEALKLIRERSNDWGVEIKQLGVMGFSAGGHLASFVITHHSFSFIQNPRNTSLKPDFALLINPIISMKDGITHTGSRDNFMGKNPSLDKKYFYSNEMFVNSQTPPVFLSHTKDDSVVPVENSLVFSERLKFYGIKHKLIVYDKGDHGYLKEPAFNQWFTDCLNWLNKVK